MRQAPEMLSPGRVMWLPRVKMGRMVGQDRVEVVTVLSGHEVEVRLPDGSHERVLRHALRWQREPEAPYRPAPKGDGK